MSKPSEEEIIKLGKKIVKELNLETSVNTLGRWMSHYVAELIQKYDNSDSETEKKIIGQECFDVILQLWKNSEHLPNVSKPLSELEPLIEILDSLKEDNYLNPFSKYFKRDSMKSSWKSWVETLKDRCNSIFELCLYSSINSDLLEKKKGWINEYKGMISEEEIKILEHLEFLVNGSKSIISFGEEKEEEINLDELEPKQKLKKILASIESELNEINSEFIKLKKELL